jgi:pilus assembly protein Flp/PilA
MADLYDFYAPKHFYGPNPTGGNWSMSKIVAFLANESGATAIEYGLIAAGISVAIIAVVNGLGTQLNAKFNDVSTQLK